MHAYQALDSAIEVLGPIDVIEHATTHMRLQGYQPPPASPYDPTEPF